jgi:CRISPR-associated endonuclease/helicase Cas3
VWDFLEREWQKADLQRLVPGQNYLLHVTAGGYLQETGWAPGSAGAVSDLRRVDETEPPEANESDELSEKQWDSIAGHTDKVVGQLGQILESLGLNERTALELATRWHDRGKAHEVFQNAILDELDGTERPAPWRNRRDVAKAPGKTRAGQRSWWTRYQRKHFRHELASALAALHPSARLPNDQRDLIAYLIAAHHGKVRLSLRSLPDERRPEDFRRFARGVWDGDVLPDVDLGGGTVAPRVVVSLEPMELGECVEEPFVGEPSWIERVLRLHHELGSFRLAYFEALLRAADERASADSSSELIAPQQSGTALVREDTSSFGDLLPELSAAEKALVNDLVSDGLEIQHKFRPEPLYKQTGKGHYEVATVEEIQSARNPPKSGDAQP